MVSIRYNRPASLTLKFVGGSGRIDLNPGVTIGVNAADWQHAQRHPIVRIMLETGELEPLISTPSVSELSVDESEHKASYNVADDAKSGQPMPVAPSKTSQPEEPPKKTTVAAPSIAPALQLLNSDPEDMKALPTIGIVSAKQIARTRPANGYLSLEQAMELNSEIGRIDWDEVEQWKP
jgi:hypothetical protein